MVTAEAAYAIASIVAAVLVAVGAVAGVSVQVRCTDAAREVARLAAAGDASAPDVGKRLVGNDARISVIESGEQVVVEVVDDVPLLPGLDLSARAVARKEPDGGDQVEFAPGVAG